MKIINNTYYINGISRTKFKRISSVLDFRKLLISNFSDSLLPVNKSVILDRIKIKKVNPAIIEGYVMNIGISPTISGNRSIVLTDLKLANTPEEENVISGFMSEKTFQESDLREGVECIVIGTVSLVKDNITNAEKILFKITGTWINPRFRIMTPPKSVELKILSSDSSINSQLENVIPNPENLISTEEFE